jgi:hypothetical protein
VQTKAVEGMPGCPLFAFILRQFNRTNAETL